MRADTLLFMLMFLTFFIGFNFLEAVQPSLVAKYSDVDIKGTAMGVFSSAQFLGIFAGGVLGGVIQTQFSYTGVFLLGAIMSLVWILIALKLPKPDFYVLRRLKLTQPLPSDTHALMAEIAQVSGVKQVSISLEEAIAYLKVDKKTVDEAALATFSTHTEH